LRKFTSNICYTLAEGKMILVRSLQRSEGDVSDPIQYIFSGSASLSRNEPDRTTIFLAPIGIIKKMFFKKCKKNYNFGGF